MRYVTELFGDILPLGNGHFLPNPFQSEIHQSFYHSTLQDVDTVHVVRHVHEITRIPSQNKSICSQSWN
jgi:hypothetical protein